MPALGEQADNVLKVIVKTDYDDTQIKKFKQDINEFRAMRISGAKLTPEERVEEGKAKEVIRRQNQEIAEQAKQRARAERTLLFSGLGVMFFMMALNRALMNLVQPAADLVGIFEIFELILALFFLPIMLKLLPVLVAFLGIVADLPGWLKEGVGLLVLVGIAFTGLMVALAQLQIFLGSIGATGAAVAIQGLIGGLISLAAPLLLVAAAIAALILYKDDLLNFFTSIQDKIREFLKGFGVEAPVSSEQSRQLMSIGFDPLNLIPAVAAARTLPGLAAAGGALASGASPSQALNIFIQNAPGIQTTVTDVGQSGASNVSVIPP